MPQSLIVTLIAAAAAGIAAAELISLLWDNRHVSVSCELDMRLTEPEEIMVLRYRVRNTGLWPLPNVMVYFSFDEGVELRENETWRRTHRLDSLGGQMYCLRMGLLPHRTLRGSLRISMQKRGVYVPGQVFVETGDFLGFRSRFRSFKLPGPVICTARLLPDDPALEPLGGFTGDVSVRRFILEDPSLVLGYREYTGTEPLKQISWLQTARTGSLTVKKHDFTVDTDVAVLVDQSPCSKAAVERCLSLTRTVCDRLEAARIPYTVLSNGDLLQTARGVGRSHSFEIQRRIGRSRFVRYRRFEELANQCAEIGAGSRGWIVVSPRSGKALEADLARLRAASDLRICLLTGEEGTDCA